MTKKLKLVFAPGAFDNFDGTQEELDELIKEIQDRFEDGSIFEKSQPVDLEDGTWSEEEIMRLEKAFSDAENSGNRTLQ